jgi:hypothetical protein
MSAAASITVHVALAIRHRPGRRTIITPNGEPFTPLRGLPARADPAMVKALARAFRWKRMLDEGRFASISKIARAEKVDRTYVGDILRLTLLAPDIIETIVDGRQPRELELARLMKPFSLDWEQQRHDLFGVVLKETEVAAPLRRTARGVARRK